MGHFDTEADWNIYTYKLIFLGSNKFVESQIQSKLADYKYPKLNSNYADLYISQYLRFLESLLHQTQPHSSFGYTFSPPPFFLSTEDLETRSQNIENGGNTS